MASTSIIYNPLEINLRRQTQLLLSIILPTSVYTATLSKPLPTRDLLTTLSRLLAVPALTQTIATIYRPILLDLCARWLLEDGVNTEEQLVALCLLVEVHEELFPVLYRLLLRSFKDGPLDFITATLSPLSINVPRLQRLLLAYYRILQMNRELPHQLLWSLAPLSNLIWTPHLDNGVRLLSIRCYALQCGMGEAEREKIEQEVLGEPCGVDCQLEYGNEMNGEAREVDGWIMPVVEVKRVQSERNAIVTKPCDYYAREEDDLVEPVSSSDLCPLIANVHGVLLLKSPGQQTTISPLIPTPTSMQALRLLAHHLSLRLPTLLTSPPSAGKSLLLTHLSSLIYPGERNQIVSIHLADTSLDPRALLGSYVSSPRHPGTFEWKEGVLVRSMREGKWVIFEDVDKGSNEVLGVIKPLVESLHLGKWVGGRAFLEVPGRRRVVAHDNFMLFATRSVPTSRLGSFPHPTFFGAHKFREVAVQSPTPDELRTIINFRFPRLAGPAAQGIIRLWDSVRALGSAASVRDVGLRELDKICVRVDALLPSSYQPMGMSSDDRHIPLLSTVFSNPTLREDMYLEARDVFFGAGALTASAREHVDAIISLIGDQLSLEPDRQKWVLCGRTPELNIEKDINGRVLAVCVGRTHLPARSSKAEISIPTSRPFAMHRPAVLLLSRIATAVSLSEPLLLTGETGTGKTSIVTHLASLLNRQLISLNLSHQTESSDLIGGLKPIDARIPCSALQERFLELFGVTFSRRKNEKFETEVRKAVTEGKWKRVVGLWKECTKLARDRIQVKRAKEDGLESGRVLDSMGPRKRRKVDEDRINASEGAWNSFMQDVEEFEVQHVQRKGKFAFGFVEGPLVKALKSGDWVLLDEINLASPETLECISGLLHRPTGSITLTEHGSLEPVPRHPDFRLFACMNPATDVGKKDLPPNIRSRFTEIDVPPPDADKETLLSIITQYIGPAAAGDKGVIMNVAEFYTVVKTLAEKRQIADGSNHRPHFSMRTLARALTFAADTASMYSLRRSIWEGCLMAFTMILDSPSAEIVTALAQKHLLAGVKNPWSMLAKEPSVPRSRSPDEFVKFGPFYLEKGPLPEDPVEDYIVTPSVETKLIDLARIILTRRFPVLIEGPTSSGKTSSIEYLAKRTGHRFVRINNHEHTDIQEYVGSYVSDPLTGKLVFKDGLLVRALRNGDWIVLDELNLAPTDVLEALNRLLDDNRELVIPETHEVVRPHPHFMLFATQNPPGLYAGRKVLSRAFRNRFLEVHFEDVPQGELETILCQRCRIAPSYGKRIVTVFLELQKRRQSSRVFESKHGFATLRDLFRWAGRDAVGYQELADNGYMLLAERARREEDKAAVQEVIESVMGVTIDESAMYDLHKPGVDMLEFLGSPMPASSNITWTKAMQRLYILICRALKFNEPVLLVGETGSGKTSVCQVFAAASSQHLHGLNCHQNTETADLIGGLRPVRNRTATEADVFREAADTLRAAGLTNISPTFDALVSATTSLLKPDVELDLEARSRVQDIHQQLLRLQSMFEWHDGPLITAMRNGDVFLLDEISLADDSVLERLNSVLEPERIIVLAERGGADFEYPAIQAVESFKLVATMNPGGDYGKKELSPALRNRFTEIWVPRVDDRHDLELIIGSMWQHDALKGFTSCVLDFMDWLCARVSDRSLMSLRDIIAWVVFSNSAYQPASADCIPMNEIFHHAAHMTFLDGLSSLPQLSAYSRDALARLQNEALAKLQEIVPLTDSDGLFATVPVHNPATSVQLGSFAIKKGMKPMTPHAFNFTAPTTRDNAMRVVRACQVPKPILLEGSPGVGKTSLITALANMSGHELCRINLSDQTDLIDLFGSDLPVEGGGPGEFAWKDAEFLKALQEGHWVLLDEMNLAPQAVLEGLNAVLDHRGMVYIPELGRSFTCHPSFRIFAAQNPLSQGGGRKGLPKSFVNRFTKVYIQELSSTDLFLVCLHLFPEFDENILRAMISFNMELNEKVGVRRSFAREGSPWEFNLRDVIRWGILLRTPGQSRDPAAYLQNVYLHRFRTYQDRQQAQSIFDRTFFTTTKDIKRQPEWLVSKECLQVGHFLAERRNVAPLARPGRVLKAQLAVLESLGDCVSQSWLAIVTGQRDSGKSEVVRTLANLTGNVLWEISVNSATDTMDILGSFEQMDVRGRVLNLVEDILGVLDHELRSAQGSKISKDLHSRACALRSVDCEGSRFSLQELLGKTSVVLSGLRHATGPDTTLDDAHKQLEDLLSTSDSAGRFQWVDGPLIKAMKNGHWLLMDGANLCNPSVLDRLNSLCEPDGFLTLSEQGFVNGRVQLIKPHPSFRLFMSVDPQYGELSRAMRNRGIEIAILPGSVADDLSILRDYFRLPTALHAACDFKLDCLEFDLARRGLSLQAVPDMHLVSSSGRMLDQDSALSTLLDQAPMLVTSSPTTILDSCVFFLARTLTPAYLPYFSRYMTTLQTSNGSAFQHIQDFLSSFPSSRLTAALTRFRHSHTIAKGVSLPFVLSQPMDFYLNTPSYHLEKSLDIAVPSPHMLVLQTLDLAAALFLDARDPLPFMDLDAHTTPSIPRALNGISVVLGTIRMVASQILDTMGDNSALPTTKEINLAQKMVEYGRYLRKTIGSSSFDFSAVQAIVRWMLEALEDYSPYAPLADHVHALNETVSLSSGLGLMNIWSTFYVGNLTWSSKEDILRVDKLACSLKSSPLTRGLRRQAFNTMALNTLPNSLITQHRSSLSEMLTVLERYLIHRSSKDTTSRSYLDGPIALIAELDALVRWDVSSSDKATMGKELGEIIELACLDNDTPLIRLLWYQRLIWSLEAEEDPMPIIVQARMQWLEALWTTPVSGYITNGPSLLTHPTQLGATVMICDSSHTPLKSLPDFENDLHRHARMALLHCRQNRCHVSQLTKLLYQLITMVVACFESSFDADVYEALQSLEGDLLSTMPRFVELLELSSYTPFRSAARMFLRPLAQRLRNTQSHRVIADIGLCWIAVSRMLFDLFVPDAPIDPAAIQNCTSDRFRQEETILAAQIHLHRRLEELLTGNTDNEVLLHLKRNLDQVNLTLSKSPVLPIRNDVARLNMLWSEVWQFQSNVIHRSKIENLVALLETGGEGGKLREKVVQESLAGFCQRLDAVYADYADINVPLKLAVLQLRTGLRLVATSLGRSHPLSESVARLCSAVIAFPSISSSAAISKLAADGPTGIAAFQHLLLGLSAASAEKVAGIESETQLASVEAIYEQALRLWHIDRAKEKELDDASQSLYRRGRLDFDAVGDAELEEQEFIALFPSFEDALEKETSHGEEITTKNPLLVPATEVLQFVAIHYKLLDPQCTPSSWIASIKDFNNIRRSVTTALLESQMEYLPDTLDDEGLPFQLRLLRDKLSIFEGSSNSKTPSYNFYTDTNVIEVKKAVSVVEALRNRLEELTEEWPDQMVLHHLMDRCDSILNLDLHSSVAKLLSALEQLLLQTEDWEMYASRNNTLKLHRQALTELIIDWRRLELSCWHGLLESQATTFAEGALEWWFRIYDATVRGPLSASDQECAGAPQTVTEYLTTLVPLLDDFISSSPLGQFQARMQLLESFESYVSRITIYKSEPHRKTLERVRCILHASRLFYRQFSLNLLSHLSQQRGLLEKEVKGFIKLASWKDINVQALKQSAQRTHHQLYKIIRKFRDVLRQPVSQRLHPQPADEAEAKPLRQDAFEVMSDTTSDLEFSPPKGHLNATSDHLLHLGRTFSKYNALINSRIRPFVRSQSASIVDDLAVNIIVAAKQLAAFSTPSDLPAEKREKLHKALLVRKRKAWSDLLKELKRAGLSSSIKPDVLRHNMDSRWIREQPIVSHLGSLEPLINKSEIYFSRLYKLLPELRSALHTHHTDLTSRELQRGVTFLESGFSMAIDLRSRVASAHDACQTLERMSSRLRMVYSSSRISIYGKDLFSIVSCMKNVLCGLSSAFEEVSEGVTIFNDLENAHKVPESTVESIAMLLDAINSCRDQLLVLKGNLESIRLPVLLDHEQDLITEALLQISRSATALSIWSSQEPRLNHLFEPVSKWLQSQIIPNLLPASSAAESQGTTTESLINTFLVSVQAMISNCPEASEDAEDGNDNDDYILRGYRTVRDFTHLLGMDTIVARLDELLASISSSEQLLATVYRVMPFIQDYLKLIKDQLLVHSQWTTTLFKLDFVLCSVMHTLANQGFCKPPEGEETEAGGEITETMDGTGLGQGSGSENVSKEIEDESQVEGLQGDDAENKESEERHDDDDAIEMSEDFGGNMEDVPDNASEDDVESDAESEMDPEERLGKLDASDPAAVDEKLWGDEQGPQNPEGGDDKADHDHSEEQGESSDVVAKEGKENSESKETSKTQEPTKEDKDNDASSPDEEQVAEEGEDEKPSDPKVSGTKMDEYVEDANTLELPEDLNLGGDDMDIGEDEIAEGQEGEMEEADEELFEDNVAEDAEMGHTNDDSTQNEETNELPAEDSGPGVDDEDMEGGDQLQEGKDDDKEAVQDKERQKDEDQKEEAVARPDVSAGQGDADANDDMNQGGESTSGGQVGSSQGMADQDVTTEDQALDNDAPTDSTQSQADPESINSHAEGTATTGTQQGQAQSQPQHEHTAINPLRSLGDALKEIRQRFDEILNSEARDAQREANGDASTQSQVEYIQPDDKDTGMQALGPAGEEQVAKLDDLIILDEDVIADSTTAMDVDISMEPERHDLPLSAHIPQEELTSSSQKEVIEGAILQNALPLTAGSIVEPNSSLPKADIDMKDEDHNVELQLRQWQAVDFPDEGAEHIWRLYESLTHDLAYALCEQLRLILEPTLATRMKGDYRTGKRLNMKKIISYIASDYTKDKIWLRRTRPSQREYQVLIAIDDSRSMAESHSIHLAYETLALISKALGRLESGDVAIAKFGETVDILHSFDEGPFTDQAGTKVVNAFKFKQKATNVLSLMDNSLKVLEAARERRSMNSATATDLWQLEIIISDGMCQDHEKLRTALRKAEEQRVMVVFIILDSLHMSNVGSAAATSSLDPHQGSILSMDKAEFRNVDGRMELQIQKYLDSFPFEYYVVLRNVESLPEVLAGTLKQFFERVSEE